MRRVLPASLVCLALGCVSQSETAPCSDDGACLPGFVCRDMVCEPCSGTSCPPSSSGGIGPSGGTACTPDIAACVEVPAGALAEFVDIQLREASGAQTGDLQVYSRVFEVLPRGVMFRAPAEVRLVATATAAGPSFGVYHSESSSGPWTRLTGSGDGSEAVGQADALSFVVAADRGSLDAGP